MHVCTCYYMWVHVYVGVYDHRVLANRCRSYMGMNRLDEALQDAELACRLRPLWAKVITIALW